MSTAITSPAPTAPALIDVRDIATQLGCSTRHVWRLADAGMMPAPIRLGSLVRWRRQDIEAWLAAGCPKVRAR